MPLTEKPFSFRRPPTGSQQQRFLLDDRRIDRRLAIVHPDSVGQLDTRRDGIGRERTLGVRRGKGISAPCRAADDPQIRQRPIRDVDQTAGDRDTSDDLDRGQLEFRRVRRQRMALVPRFTGLDESNRHRDHLREDVAGKGIAFVVSPGVTHDGFRLSARHHN